MLKFFATSAGKKTAAAFAGSASIVGFGASYLPETLYIDSYTDFWQNYHNGFKVEPDETLKTRLASVIADLKLSNAKKEKITPFITSSRELFTIGSVESDYGARIGIPYSYLFEKIEDISTEMLAIGDMEIDWTWPAGKLYRESFVLSDAAQKFSFAKGLYFTDTSQLKTRSLSACGCILNVYILARVFNKRFQRYPFLVRGIMYSLVSLIGLIAHFAISDMANYANETKALEKALDLGPMYVEGAMEFYQKSIVRNKTLRVLLKKDGHSMFTPQGERVTFIRTKNLPLTVAYEKVKQKKEELSKSENAN